MDTRSVSKYPAPSMPPVKLLVVVSAICLSLPLNPRAAACDLCAIYTAAGARGEGRTGFGAGLAGQFTRFGTLQLDGSEVPNPTDQYLDSSITQAFVSYGFNDRIAVQLNVPYIHRSFQRPEGFATDKGTEAGTGDVSLLGRFQLWRKDTQDFAFNSHLLGGLKFPTGSSIRLKEELHESEVPGAPESGIHGHDLTLGSGSTDAVVGAEADFRYRRCFATASVQYAIRSEGDYDYRFANDLSWEAGPGIYLLLGHAYTVALQCMLTGEHKGTDTFQGNPAADTGLTSVYLGPRLTATWQDRLSAEIGADFPVTIRNTALQAVPDYRLRAALTWHF